MREFFSDRIPDADRVLLVESGSRSLLDGFIPKFAQNQEHTPRIDLVTCFAGVPLGFDRYGDTLYRVTDYAGPAGREKLYRELKAKEYDMIGIICSEEPLMTKWKWMLAARVPAKLFVINENGDYFWADYTNFGLIIHFMLVRAGLSGAGAVTTLGRLVMFPFTLLYLLLFAAFISLQRKVRA